MKKQIKSKTSNRYVRNHHQKTTLHRLLPSRELETSNGKVLANYTILNLALKSGKVHTAFVGIIRLAPYWTH